MTFSWRTLHHGASHQQRGVALPVSVSHLRVLADTSGDALRLLRAAMNLMQAGLVAHADGTIGADQLSLIERGNGP